MSYYNGKVYTKVGEFKFNENQPEILKQDCTINEVSIMEQDEWYEDLEVFKRLGFIDEKGYIIIPAGTTITLLPPKDKYTCNLREFQINDNENDKFTVSCLCSIDGLLADAVLGKPDEGEPSGYIG